VRIGGLDSEQLAVERTMVCDIVCVGVCVCVMVCDVVCVGVCMCSC
jgi:hypothetical protein